MSQIQANYPVISDDCSKREGHSVLHKKCSECTLAAVHDHGAVLVDYQTTKVELAQCCHAVCPFSSQHPIGAKGDCTRISDVLIDS